MGRHKIVLYNPRAVFFDMPLALLAVGSSLDRERFEIVIVDARLSSDPHAELLSHLDGALCLGVTVLTGSPLRDALAATRAAKADHPTLPIVWGGWHPSLFPAAVLDQEESVDVTVQAQGEVTFRELCDRLAAGDPLVDLAGTTVRGSQGPQRNPPRAMIDMNRLPAVDYGLIDVERYFRAKGRRQLDYISSTGCLFRCRFCADPFVFQRRWTAIEPERLGSELEHLVRMHQVEDVNFQDETFFTYRKRVVGICEEFLRRDLQITWAATMRADQGVRLTEEDFEHLAASGLRRVLIGVESGSQEMVDWMQKDIKLEHVWSCAERCRRFGIDAIFPFIVGFPGETTESVRASLAMARDLRRYSSGFSTPIFYFKPYPGSSIVRDAEASGHPMPETLDEWADFDYIGSSGPWVDPTSLSLVERFKFYNRLAGGTRPWYLRPLQQLARWRLDTERLAWPIEKTLASLLVREPELS